MADPDMGLFGKTFESRWVEEQPEQAAQIQIKLNDILYHRTPRDDAVNLRLKRMDT